MIAREPQTGYWIEPPGGLGSIAVGDAPCHSSGMTLSLSAIRLHMAAAFGLVAAVSCGRSYRPTSVPRPADTAPATDAPSTPSRAAPDASTRGRSYPPEATACTAASDCERVSLRDDMELNGGPCCSVCGGYVALNRAYQARQPACDARVRGSCPVSCTEGRPPPVACEAGHCVLTYPPVVATCTSDSDCVSVPRLLTNAPANACRIACGQYVAGSREWDAWAASLWQNTSVTGVCPPDCSDRLLPSAMCVATQCVLRAPSVVRLTRVDLRAPTATGTLPAAAIASVVAQNQGRFLTCQERPRSIDPIGYAGFEMHFDLGADGRVATIDAGELADHLPDIAACMTRVIRELQFPRPTGGATVRVAYPMGAAFETR